MLRLGIDTGGTNTDAAVLSADNRVLGSAKHLTTPDVLSGITAAVEAALQDAGQDPSAIAAAMLGTTQFVNAVVQLQGLSSVAVVRLCGPATRALPPCCALPPALRAAVGGATFMASGGYEYDGSHEISPLDEPQLRRIARQIAEAGIRCCVVAGVFSPVRADQEERAAAALQAAAPGLLLCCSLEVGQLGLLERENAAVLNAALLPLARRVVPACAAALAAAGVRAPLFFTSNDGTLLSAEQVLRTPVATFQSGPVNSMRGAALLARLPDHTAAVLDIGGTTTDAGLVMGGLPRPAPRAARFAGADTNLQMPDVFSVGLGGGSLVRFPSAASPSAATAAGPAAAGSLQACTVGPDSVGATLLEQALLAGGPCCTASDVAVLRGRLELGSWQAVAAGGLTPERAEAAWQAVQRQLEACVDQAKLRQGDIPVIVVGGGAPLCGESLRGASRVVRPPHATVASAVGAAVAQVSGTVDAVFDLGGSAASRAAVLRRVEEQAEARCLAAGARPGSCWLAQREEVPLAYLPGSIARLRVQVIGDLDVGSLGASAASGDSRAFPAGEPAAPAASATEAPSSSWQAVPDVVEGWPPLPGQGEEPSLAALAAWQPEVDEQGDWVLHAEDLHLLAIGCGLLGCGGGGSPSRALLQALMQLQRSGVGSMRVISPAAVPDEGLVGNVGGMGAPSVSAEKLESDAAATAVQAALAAYRATCPRGSSGAAAQLAAVMPFEAGGGNGLEPLAVGARLRVPVVDCDLMGRAFPEVQMTTTAIYGARLLPAALSDEKGNVVAVQAAASPAWLERLLRPLCAEMGCSAGCSDAPLPGLELRRVAVPHSLSRAWHLGRAVASAQTAKQDAAAAVAAAGGGRVLFTGNVVDVQRITTAGFARGHMDVQGRVCCSDAGASGTRSATSDSSRRLRILFQNEFTVAQLLGAAPGVGDSASAAGDAAAPVGAEAPSGEVLAAVPDLIILQESSNGLPVAVEEVRYGLRVAVSALPAHPLLTTPEALAVVGPAAFGHPHVAYAPLQLDSSGALEPHPIPRPPAVSG